jgi:hypothetical protein
LHRSSGSANPLLFFAGKPRKIEERLVFIGDMAEAKGKTRQRVHRECHGKPKKQTVA